LAIRSTGENAVGIFQDTVIWGNDKRLCGRNIEPEKIKRDEIEGKRSSHKELG